MGGFELIGLYLRCVADTSWVAADASVGVASTSDIALGGIPSHLCLGEEAERGEESEEDELHVLGVRMCLSGLR